MSYGKVASTYQSKKLDSMVKSVRDEMKHNFNEFTMQKKLSKVELFIVICLTILFAAIWLFAHWNLSRQPPHHKGPGSVGYEEPSTPIKK